MKKQEIFKMNYKKIISVFIMVIVISSGIFSLPKKSEAFLFGSIVIDPAHISAAISNWAQSFFHRLQDIALNIALNNLKKRLLDSIVDQTINWVNGGGRPQFVTDFKGYLKDSANAAAGDIAIEVGLGRICQPFRNQLQFDLGFSQQTRFSRQVSCTLDQVVSNINNFYNDFSQGGFVGFNELLKPQNNYYGALLLSMNEMSLKQGEAGSASEQQVISGQGFVGNKMCLEWTLYAYNTTKDQLEEIRNVGVSQNFDYPDPNQPPPASQIGILSPNLINPVWGCSVDSTPTPGTVIADATQKAVGVHTDYVVAADDLTGYLSALIDAGLNRLIGEGVKGFTNLASSNSNLPPAGYFTSGGTVPTNISTAGGGYNNSQGQITATNKAELLNNLNTAEASLNVAVSDSGTALSNLKNAETLTLTLINWCNAGNASFHFYTCQSLPNFLSSVYSAMAPIQQVNTQATNDLATVATLRTQVNALSLSNLNPSIIGQISALLLSATDLENQSSGMVQSSSLLLNQITATSNSCMLGTGSCP